MKNFIDWLKSFFDTRTDYQRGQAFAQDCIEKGRDSVADLMVAIDVSRQMGDFNDFDCGAETELQKRRDLWPDEDHPSCAAKNS